MVELSVVSTEGLPERPVLSVRCGQIRRQQPLPLKAPFALPDSPGPYKIDVSSWYAWSKATKGVPKPKVDTKENYKFKVQLTSWDGRTVTVTFAVCRLAIDMNKKIAANDPSSFWPQHVMGCMGREARQLALRPDEASQARSAALLAMQAAQARSAALSAVAALGAGLTFAHAAQAQRFSQMRGVVLQGQINQYFARHRLAEFLKGIFAQIMKTQPDDPYAFFASKVAEAAGVEAQGCKPALTQTLRREPAAEKAKHEEGPRGPTLNFLKPGWDSGCDRQSGGLRRLHQLELRQRGIHSLVESGSKGRLAAALNKIIVKDT